MTYYDTSGLEIENPCINGAKFVLRSRPYYSATILINILKSAKGCEELTEAFEMLEQVFLHITGKPCVNSDSVENLEEQVLALQDSSNPLIRIRCLSPQKNPKLEELRYACCNCRGSLVDWPLILDLSRTAANSLRMEAKAAYYVYGAGDQECELLHLCDDIFTTAHVILKEYKPKTLFDTLDRE